MQTPPEGYALLSLLDEAARARWLRRCAERRYAGGEQIVRELEHDDNIYFIRRGKVRVTLLSRDGREVNFADLNQGENFGEISLIDGQPRSANVVALIDTEMVVMPARVFGEMLRAHPPVALQLLRQMTAMIRRLCERIFEYSTLGVNNRIHAELLRLGKSHLDLDGVARIKAMPTHAQLASRVSCHREAVSRELKTLEKQGIVAKKNRKFIIPNLQILQEMVDAVGIR